MAVVQQRRRLAAVVTHPIQYFKPIFQGLAADPEVELLVVYGCDHGLEASALVKILSLQLILEFF